ncbi:MAG TPA: lytic transglycosylase domain-containing protein [Thermoanaerobaculia bacterium]|nr:lytic transglycosylase domain-containing protein [Thermoanaerobaculia bacterium]
MSRPRILVPLALSVLALAAGRAGAELVVLRGGAVLKVTAYEVGEEKARLELPSGGALTVSLLRIERIVADEVVAEPQPLPAVAVTLAFRDQPPPSVPYGEVIHAAARRHEVNPQVVAAMMRVESAHQPRAVSHKGARGLMQLMPATAARFGVGVDELFDPQRNVEAGVRYLRWLVDRFGDDPPRVLAAYNAGEGAVERYGGVPPYRETQGYVHRILVLLGAGDAGAAVAAR